MKMSDQVLIAIRVKATSPMFILEDKTIFSWGMLHPET